MKVQVTRVPHPRSPAHLLDELRSSYAKTILTPKEQIENSWELTRDLSEKQDRADAEALPTDKRTDQVVLGRKELVHERATGGEQQDQRAGTAGLNGMPRSVLAARNGRRTEAVL